ncbi:MAG: hypothetical protein JWM16_29 [Verrucomicrobiales bacterium]|nr:hypothetical protein [Verrucomicrobiales bacterium]
MSDNAQLRATKRAAFARKVGAWPSGRRKEALQARLADAFSSEACVALPGLAQACRGLAKGCKGLRKGVGGEA